MNKMKKRLFEDAGHGEGGALEGLALRDADMARALETYGPPPDRSLPATYQTLARIIVGQQVSRAAASSILGRMRERGLEDPENVASRNPEQMMEAGLSRRKAEYIIGIAREVVSGGLDFKKLARMPGEDVQKRLVEIRGVGEWTADNFRLFSMADMDAWPVNDVALQEAMRILKSKRKRPTAEQMERLGRPWRPYRGAGALMLWHLYAVEVRKTTVADI